MILDVSEAPALHSTRRLWNSRLAHHSAELQGDDPLGQDLSKHLPRLGSYSNQPEPLFWKRPDVLF